LSERQRGGAIASGHCSRLRKSARLEVADGITCDVRKIMNPAIKNREIEKKFLKARER